jgi:hypothetical protein
MLGNKALASIICVACTDPFGEHSKRQLIRCLFRVQGTMVSNEISSDKKEEPEKIEDQE